MAEEVLWLVGSGRDKVGGSRKGEGRKRGRQEEGRKGMDGGEGERRGDRRTGEEIRGEGRAREKRQ